MSRTILSNVEGFTPLIDTIVMNHGILTAVVFGKIWRYCQMESGVCHASQARIGRELGLRRETINFHISVLLEHEYIEDLTPGLVGGTHIYRDTGKASLVSAIVAVTQTNNQTPTCDLNAQGVLVKPTGGVSLSHTNRVLRDKEDTVTPAEGDATNMNAWDLLREGKEVKNQRAKDAMDKYEARQDKRDWTGWPEDTIPWAEKFTALWRVEPSKRVKSRWIDDIRNLQAACEGFGLALLDELYKDYANQERVKGRPPYTVSAPGSLVNASIARVAEHKRAGKSAPVPTTLVNPPTNKPAVWFNNQIPLDAEDD